MSRKKRKRPDPKKRPKPEKTTSPQLSKEEQKRDYYLSQIRSKRRRLSELEAKFRSDPRWTDFDDSDPEKLCWCAMGHSLEKIRLIIENSLQQLDTLGLVSSTRFIFELSIWLFLFDKDRNYGFVYQLQSLESHLKHEQAYLSQCEREIAFLKHVEVLDSANSEMQIKAVSKSVDKKEKQQAWDDFKTSENALDDWASRKFSIHAEEAKKNGYGYHAVLMEEQILHPVSIRLEKTERDLNAFRESLSDEAKAMTSKRWNWRMHSKDLGFEDEYTYIYSMTSKFLHASPFGISTSNKELIEIEKNMLLNYINVKVLDLIELAQKWLDDGGSH